MIHLHKLQLPRNPAASSQIPTSRARLTALGPHPWRQPNSRRRTARATCGGIHSLGNIHASFRQPDRRHHPSTTAALHTLPGEFPNVGPTARVGTRETTGQRSVDGVVVVRGVCVRIAAFLHRRWEQTGPHPFERMEKDMCAFRVRRCSGASLRVSLMVDDE